MKAARACPICKKPVPTDPRPRTAPFCGPRCRAADLGSWFAGDYAIDAGPAPTMDESLNPEGYLE